MQNFRACLKQVVNLATLSPSSGWRERERERERERDCSSHTVPHTELCCYPCTLNSSHYVGGEEQPSGGAHRNVPTGPLAKTDDKYVLRMFKEDCEKEHVPACSLEGVEKEVDEYRGLVSTKPIEEIVTSHVMEETKSDSGGSTFVYLGPAVSVAPKATPSTKCE